MTGRVAQVPKPRWRNDKRNGVRRTNRFTTDTVLGNTVVGFDLAVLTGTFEATVHHNVPASSPDRSRSSRRRRCLPSADVVSEFISAFLQSRRARRHIRRRCRGRWLELVILRERRRRERTVDDRHDDDHLEKLDLKGHFLLLPHYREGLWVMGRFW